MLTYHPWLNLLEIVKIFWIYNFANQDKMLIEKTPINKENFIAWRLFNEVNTIWVWLIVKNYV